MSDLLNHLELLNAISKATEQLAAKERSGNSRYPYYHEEAANEVIDTIAEVLTKGRPVIWPCSGITMTTLYNKFRQGARYVMDVIDKDFANKLAMVQVNRIPKVGLKIVPRHKLECTAVVVDHSWKREFEDFLENSNVGQAFERYNLALSDADIEYLTAALFELRSLFIYELPSKHNNRLLVVRSSAKVYDHSGDSQSADRETREFIGEGTDGTTGAADPNGPT